MGRRFAPKEVERITRKAKELRAIGITVKLIAERFGVSADYIFKLTKSKS
jgi:orotate phosphoribosyltransferase-like protein